MKSAVFAALASTSIVNAAAVCPAPPPKPAVEHVALFSIDGLHGSDVPKYIALRPNSNINMLLNTGMQYTNAFTSAPSDSFPGTVAQYTGGAPNISGIYYDDVWDPTYWAAGSNCQGAPGAEVVYDESIDYNSSQVFSGGIDPAKLPLTLVNGKCTEIYPHNRLQINTIMEVVRKNGGVTAYTDKHPAYDLVRGPSGNGLNTGYFPEMAAYPSGLNSTIMYDQLHTTAFLDWLDGVVPANSEGGLNGAIPTVFGGNYQAVSVAQKTYGYVNATGSPLSPQIIQALDATDAAIGSVIAKLKAKNLYEKTLVIIASKHGQAPININLYGKVDPLVITNGTGVPVAFQTSDDIALIWLENPARDLMTAVNNLEALPKAKSQIAAVIYGTNKTMSGFTDESLPPRSPDIVVQPQLGIIYTTSTKKVAEHGGLSADDRNVACIVSHPAMTRQSYGDRVYTRQVAPTVLKALGLDVSQLDAVRISGTQELPGLLF